MIKNENNYFLHILLKNMTWDQTGSFVKDIIKQESTRYKYDRCFELSDVLMVLSSRIINK